MVPRGPHLTNPKWLAFPGLNIQQNRGATKPMRANSKRLAPPQVGGWPGTGRSEYNYRRWAPRFWVPGSTAFPHSGRKPAGAAFQSGFPQPYSSFLALCALTLNHIGVPAKPKASRIWFSRKRSKLKCSLTSRSAKSTNVGGATAACVM